MIYHVVKQQTYILYTYDIDQSKSRFYSWSKLYHLVVFTAWSKWMDKHWSGKYVSYTYPAQSNVNRCPFYNLYSPKCWQWQLKLIFNSLHGTIGIINLLVGGGLRGCWQAPSLFFFYCSVIHYFERYRKIECTNRNLCSETLFNMHQNWYLGRNIKVFLG